MVHCAGNPDTEELNRLLTEFHGLVFPWEQVTSLDARNDLVQMLRENY